MRGTGEEGKREGVEMARQEDGQGQGKVLKAKLKGDPKMGRKTEKNQSEKNRKKGRQNKEKPGGIAERKTTVKIEIWPEMEK